MSALDYVFVAVIVLFVVQGLIKGFIHGLFSVIAVGGGLAVGAIWGSYVAGFYDELLGVSVWSPVLGFLSLFILVYAVVKLVENVLDKFIEKVNLESLDKALGFFLGIIKGVIVVAVLIMILAGQQFVDFSRALEVSFFYKLISPVLPDLSLLIDSASKVIR
ncbi:CvpA family protein [Spirochaetia bacterium 38H-sp]|uniref:CvpA family protein n=1 Tax=Rarispira pelagica TaxID=3141764 RepID=A0ABU9UDS4_9SPIR